MNRRRFLLTLGTAVAANAAGSLRPLRAAEKAGRTPLTVTELGERLFVVCGGGGNVTVFHPDEGVLLVDGGSPERSTGNPPRLARSGSRDIARLFRLERGHATCVRSFAISGAQSHKRCRASSRV